MKYIKTYERLKKVEDPFYHLAVTINDFIWQNGDFVSSGKGIYGPEVKWFYSNIRIKTKYRDFVFINKKFIKNYFVLSFSDNLHSSALIVLEKLKELFINYKKVNNIDTSKVNISGRHGDGTIFFPNECVDDLTDYINMYVVSDKYNL